MSNIRKVSAVELTAVLDAHHPFPTIVVYWDPKDPNYEKYEQKLTELALDLDPRITIYTVEVADIDLRIYGSGRFTNLCPLFGHTRRVLPTLQVVTAYEHTRHDSDVRPGFVGGHNFLPAMSHMFRLAAKALNPI